MKKPLPIITGFILASFGLLTFVLSSSIIFDLFDIRVKQGNYVLFVVWANFISSIIYLFAAYGFIKNRKWTTVYLGLAAILLIFTYIGLKIHINSGGVYETKTVGAILLRITLTLAFTLISYFIISKKKSLNY